MINGWVYMIKDLTNDNITDASFGSLEYIDTGQSYIYFNNRDNKGDDMDNTDLKKLSEIATTFLKEVDLIEAKAPNYTNTYSTMYLVNVVKIFFECLMKKHSEGDVEHHLEIEENLFIDNEADQNDEVRSHILERSLKHKRKYPYN